MGLKKKQDLNISSIISVSGQTSPRIFLVGLQSFDVYFIERVGMELVLQQERSLAGTPTYSVASVVTVLVFVCYLVERAICRFGKWLKKTRRKALFASLEKIKEELMLLGLISLLLALSARSISQICVNSSLFGSRFYICSEKDYSISQNFMLKSSVLSPIGTATPPRGINTSTQQCGEGREPFVSYKGLEQLHRFLFVLGITHVLYSCVAVGLAMSKIYSWRKWENEVAFAAEENLQAKKNKVMRRQTTFVFHHTSHPWSRSPVLIWMLCFLQQFKSSVTKSDYLALRLGFITKHKLPLSYNFHKYIVRSMEDEFHGVLGISYPLWGYAILFIFINVHGLNIYFWLSFIPAIVVMVVGTKLQHVVSSLALQVDEQAGASIATHQVKPSDDLFWFRKPQILLRFIQFITFQNALEMATFIWSLWALKDRWCFMKNIMMIIIRLTSGVIVQFWCSYSTVPLNVIVTQMGSQHRKALVAERVRESLHSWYKRVKERSRRDALASSLSVTTRSVCSLESAIDEREEIILASPTLSRSSSMDSMNQFNLDRSEVPKAVLEPLNGPELESTFRVLEEEDIAESRGEGKVEAPLDLFLRT